MIQIVAGGVSFSGCSVGCRSDMRLYLTNYCQFEVEKQGWAPFKLTTDDRVIDHKLYCTNPGIYGARSMGQNVLPTLATPPTTYSK